MNTSTSPVRIGLLAASRIAAGAVVDPASRVDGVDLVAVGARDLGRAQEAANRWGIGAAYGSYEELLAADDIDAIYVATPATLHRRWTIAALEAGKHVLVEKPLAANAEDATRILEAVEQHPELVCMEAFHWRYHPLSQLAIDAVASGRFGTLTSVTSRFNLVDSAIAKTDIRWDYSLGGGATMDLGCYPIQWVRSVTESLGLPQVTAAAAVTPVEGVDGRLTATLAWPGLVELVGMVESSMIESDTAGEICDLRVVGDDGELYFENPLRPWLGSVTERVDSDVVVHGPDSVEGGTETTYFHQLVAFRNAVLEGAPFPTTIASGVDNMAIIDACYQAAGQEPRPTDLH